MERYKKHIGFVLIGFSVLTLVLFLVYNTVDKENPRARGTRTEILGEIETPAKKVLNGYLGSFFRFKYLGNINWLIIPLLIWFFTSSRKKERWHYALLFAWGVTTIFISIKGCTNPRYQLTLFPLTSIITILLLWQFLIDKKKYVKIFGISVFTAVVIFNIFHYRTEYQKFWELRVTRQKNYFPSKVIDYINSTGDINDQSRVFVINQPIYYYYTTKKGLDYLDPNSMGIWLELNKPSGSRERAYHLLKRRHHGNYVLLKTIHLRHSRRLALNEFLHCECKLVLENNGWLLYRLRDFRLEKELTLPQYEKINVWNRRGASVQKLSPPLTRFSSRGTFAFEITKKKNGKALVVHNTAPDQQRRLLSFGYEFKPKSIDMKIPENRYISFIVDVSASPRLVNNKNYFMISDHNQIDDTRESVKTSLESPHSRTYIVSKKVRPGATRLILAFRFEPPSGREILTVENVRVVVSDNPL
jgi:hypothetical protein